MKHHVAEYLAMFKISEGLTYVYPDLAIPALETAFLEHPGGLVSARECSSQVRRRAWLDSACADGRREAAQFAACSQGQGPVGAHGFLPNTYKPIIHHTAFPQTGMGCYDHMNSVDVQPAFETSLGCDIWLLLLPS